MQQTKNYKSLPNLPGIYIFRDTTGEILYVGKAKSLRERVRSYFCDYYVDWKVETLLQRFETIDYIVTLTEEEALVLEAQIVSTYKPPFNVLLKSDSVFTYLIFNDQADDNLPCITLTRLLPFKTKKITIYGPFVYSSMAKRVYEYLMDAFQLNRCNKSIEQGCLKYHLGSCCGSCKRDFNSQAFIDRYNLAKAIFSRDREKFLIDLDRLIKEAVATLAFEEAQQFIRYRENVAQMIEWLESVNRGNYDKQIAAVITDNKLTKTVQEQGLTELAALLGLSNPIVTIDCIDVSHFQGHSVVASCIRFFHAKANFQQTRIIVIPKRLRDMRDDYASIEYALQKIYKKGESPDVLMIDGGKGQRSVAKRIIPTIPVIALAKKEERLFYDGNLDGLVLSSHTFLGKFLISLRNTAHRTAISFHRFKRLRKQFKNDA